MLISGGHCVKLRTQVPGQIAYDALDRDCTAGSMVDMLSGLCWSVHLA